MANTSGKFSSSHYTAAGSSYERHIEVVWSATNDKANNKSTINWTAYARSTNSSTTNWVYAKYVVVTINGTATTVIGATATKLYKDKSIGSGSITVSHGSDGTKSVSVGITAQIYSYGATNSSYSGSITMKPNPVYTLSVSAGTGSSITVNRTSCAGVGSTGDLSAGSKKLCKGDKLKISFSPSTNYSITTHSVNGSSFTSGGTHTVSGNVSVVATATPLKSKIGATDANIGSTSTITVTRYNSSYTHTITYKLGSATGTVCTKSSNTSIAWTVPTAFYAQIPNAKTGTCTLTLETFNGSTSLGTSTCTLTVTASSSACSPTVNGTVVDTNATTIALTGNSSTLIKYKSNALCTLTATRKNSATISSMKIADSTVTGTTSGDVTTATKTFNGVSGTSFKFEATDSRGYYGSKTVTPTMVNYVVLTINPTLSRPTPTGSSIVMSFSGNYYRGSFGAYNNTLTLRYRYKESTNASYGSWQTIASTSYVFGTNSFRTTSNISIGNNFDYQKSYDFQVRAYDGANGTTLTSVTKTITVKRGIPVFDWGENDFNFHVPIKIGNTTLTEAQLQQLLALIT